MVGFTIVILDFDQTIVGIQWRVLKRTNQTGHDRTVCISIHIYSAPNGKCWFRVIESSVVNGSKTAISISGVHSRIAKYLCKFHDVYIATKELRSSHSRMIDAGSNCPGRVVYIDSYPMECLSWLGKWNYPRNLVEVCFSVPLWISNSTDSFWAQIQRITHGAGVVYCWVKDRDVMLLYFEDMIFEMQIISGSIWVSDQALNIWLSLTL